MTARLVLSDDASAPPLQITPRATEPSSPSTNDIYLDDGSNTVSGNPSFRQWNGASWDDLTSADAAGTTYTPVDGGDWTEGAPDDVAEALDALAARNPGTSGGRLTQWDQEVGASDISTTSTTMVDMTNMSITLTTGANPVEIHFSAGVGHDTNSGVCKFQLVIDGTPVANTLTEIRTPTNSTGPAVHLMWIQTMTAGEHTFKVQWCVSAGTGYNRASTGTEHRILSVKEFG